MTDKINYGKLASEIEAKRDTYGFLLIAKLLGNLYAFLFTVAVVYSIPLITVQLLGYRSTDVLNPVVLLVIAFLVYFLVTKPLIRKYIEIYFLLSFILSCFVFGRQSYSAGEWGDLFITVIVVGFIHLALCGIEYEKNS